MLCALIHLNSPRATIRTLIFRLGHVIATTSRLYAHKTYHSRAPQSLTGLAVGRLNNFSQFSAFARIVCFSPRVYVYTRFVQHSTHASNFSVKKITKFNI